MIPCRKRSDRVIQTINRRINDVGRSQAYAIDGMEVRRFLQIACFEDMDDPQRLLRDALRPRFRMDSHLPSDYEFEERKRNKMDDECVILSSGNLCGYNFLFSCVQSRCQQSLLGL